MSSAWIIATVDPLNNATRSNAIAIIALTPSIAAHSVFRVALSFPGAASARFMAVVAFVVATFGAGCRSDDNAGLATRR